MGASRSIDPLRVPTTPHDRELAQCSGDGVLRHAATLVFGSPGGEDESALSDRGVGVGHLRHPGMSGAEGERERRDGAHGDG